MPDENLLSFLVVLVLLGAVLTGAVDSSASIPSFDPTGAYQRYLHAANDGLPRAAQPKKVVIVGAGMAGLSAASAMLKAGHHVRLSHHK